MPLSEKDILGSNSLENKNVRQCIGKVTLDPHLGGIHGDMLLYYQPAQGTSWSYL